MAILDKLTLDGPFKRERVRETESDSPTETDKQQKRVGDTYVASPSHDCISYALSDVPFGSSLSRLLDVLTVTYPSDFQ